MATFSAIMARAEFKKRSGLFNFDMSPIQVECENPECRKTVASDTKWHCGHCQHSNRRTGVFSFLNKCQKCGKEPKSYLCPHCNDPIFLDGDSDASNPARPFVEARKIKSNVREQSPREKKRREHAERLEDLKQEIEFEKHKAELAQIIAPVDPNKGKTEYELAKDRVRAIVGADLNVKKALKEVEKEEVEKVKDDQDAVEDVKDSIKNANERLSGPQF